MINWSERIPAALAKGERLLQVGQDWVVLACEEEEPGALTAGEVALATALWGWEWWAHRMGLTEFEPSDALIAYTEKMEAEP